MRVQSIAQGCDYLRNCACFDLQIYPTTGAMCPLEQRVKALIENGAIRSRATLQSYMMHVWFGDLLSLLSPHACMRACVHACVCVLSVCLASSTCTALLVLVAVYVFSMGGFRGLNLFVSTLAHG